LRRLFSLQRDPLSEVQRSPMGNRALLRPQQSARAQLLQNLFQNQPYQVSRNPLPKESSPKQPPTKGPIERSPVEPSAEKAKKSAPSVPSSKPAQLLQRSAVRGKIVKVQYFEE